MFCWGYKRKFVYELNTNSTFTNQLIEKKVTCGIISNYKAKVLLIGGVCADSKLKCLMNFGLVWRNNYSIWRTFQFQNMNVLRCDDKQFLICILIITITQNINQKISISNPVNIVIQKQKHGPTGVSAKRTII